MTPVMAEAQNRMSEALAVLKKFSGMWVTRTRILNEGPPRREFNTRGKAICRQTLEGRYFEFRSQSIPAGQADLQVMTYDVQAGVYRQWVFDSDGYRHQAEGQWDSASSTLRWQGKTADTPSLSRIIGFALTDWSGPFSGRTLRDANCRQFQEPSSGSRISKPPEPRAGEFPIEPGK